MQSEWDFVRRLFCQCQNINSILGLKKKKKGMFLATKELTYFLSQIVSSYWEREFMLNKSVSNILLLIPSTDQERTLASWHSPAANMCIYSAWTSHHIPIEIFYLEWPVLWNHEEESAARKKQECHIAVIWKDSIGLPAVAEHHPSGHPALLLTLSLLPQLF